ncbi:MAG: hypothetical protein AAF363_19290 [Bacteroidota bacterium]
MILIFFVCTTVLKAQSVYDELVDKIPEEVIGFKLSQKPEVESVKVNGEKNYSLAAYYNKGVEDYFSFRLNAYPDNPEFINGQIKALENAPKEYEDDDVHFKTVELGGFTAQMNHDKSSGSFDVTVFVDEEARPWLLTTMGRGYENEDQAIEAMKMIMKSIM